MSEMKEQRKPKRKLSDIDFSKTGAHMALVSKNQGGPANGADYALVIKSVNFSDEFVTKAAKVRITMDIEDFLVKFYGLWYEDAEILARALGFDMDDENESDMSETYEDYITSKVEAIEILKALNEADSIPTVLSGLTEDQYLSVLTSQEKLEKAFKVIDKQSKVTKATKTVKAIKTESKPVVKQATVEDTSPASEVNKDEVTPSNVKLNMEKSMTQETQVIEKEVEVIEKSAFVALEKSLNEQKVLLEKAMLQVQQYEAEKKEQIVKTKTAQVQAVVKDEALTQVIAKAALALESEDDFKAFMTAMQTMQTKVDSSELFVEKGATVETEQKPETSHVERLLKAKFAAK